MFTLLLTIPTSTFRPYSTIFQPLLLPHTLSPFTPSTRLPSPSSTLYQMDSNDDNDYPSPSSYIDIQYTTSSSSQDSTPFSDIGIFDDTGSARPDLVSRFSSATTVDDEEGRPIYKGDYLSPVTTLAMASSGSGVTPAAPAAHHADSTSNLVLALLHALEADPADIASRLHALDQQHGGTPSLEYLSKQGIIPYHEPTPLAATLASSTSSSGSSSSTTSTHSPDSPNEAIVASITRIAQRLARSEEIVREGSHISSSSSNNTTPSTDNEGGPPPSAASLAVNAASSAVTGTGNAVSRLIGMYNTKSSTGPAPSSTTLRRASSTALNGQQQQLNPLPTQIQGDGSVRPDKEGENEEDERLCHRCGGHIIRASEVGLADEEVIDGQSESLSAEKELKLLKAQVQDFARVCKVRLNSLVLHFGLFLYSMLILFIACLLSPFLTTRTHVNHRICVIRIRITQRLLPHQQPMQRLSSSSCRVSI